MSDLISRNDEDIAKAFQFGMALGFGKKYDEMDTVIEEVKKVISPQPKMGRWKYIQYDKPPIGNWHCSKCGRIVFLLNSQKSGETPLYDYCPWCGAKMQESEEV